MVGPAGKRAAVAHLRAVMGLSERRACNIVAIDRTTVRYTPKRPADRELRERLRELANARRRFGYRRLFILLRQRALGALGNIDAVLANTGTEDSSPSSWAVKNRFQQQSEEVISQTGWNARMQSKALRQQASYDRNASTLYMLSGMRAKAAAEDNASALETNGWMNAGGGVLKGLSGLKWS